MKREAKIGIFAVAMILAAWAGIRFLKGFDIFSRNIEYYAAYDQVNGVQAASPIMMQGVKIGSVTEISFDPATSDKVILHLTINRRFRIPSDSEAKIFSNGLMGNKAIEIIYGTSATYLQRGDTLRSGHSLDLMDVAGSELEFFKQKVAQVTDDLSQTLGGLNRLIETNEQNIAGTLGNLNSMTGNMASLLVTEKQNLRATVQNLTTFTEMLATAAPRMDSIVGNMNTLTRQLAEEEFARELSATVAGLNKALESLNSRDGSLGLLLNDTALYDSLTTASGNLAALLADFKQYPGRYIHFSVFGRDPEKSKAKADKKAAKAAKKAAKAAGHAAN